jgi:hypothetical protein
MCDAVTGTQDFLLRPLEGAHLSLALAQHYGKAIGLVVARLQRLAAQGKVPDEGEIQPAQVAGRQQQQAPQALAVRDVERRLKEGLKQLHMTGWVTRHISSVPDHREHLVCMNTSFCTSKWWLHTNFTNCDLGSNARSHCYCCCPTAACRQREAYLRVLLGLLDKGAGRASQVVGDRAVQEL